MLVSVRSKRKKLWFKLFDFMLKEICVKFVFLLFSFVNIVEWVIVIIDLKENFDCEHFRKLVIFESVWEWNSFMTFLQLKLALVVSWV
jgi:hypothetical protein